MKIELTITAVADRDPSCNLFTLTEVHTFGLSSPPTVDKIRDLCEEHKAKFLAAWPHPRNNKPTLVPIDATAREVNR